MKPTPHADHMKFLINAIAEIVDGEGTADIAMACAIVAAYAIHNTVPQRRLRLQRAVFELILLGEDMDGRLDA